MLLWSSDSNIKGRMGLATHEILSIIISTVLAATLGILAYTGIIALNEFTSIIGAGLVAGMTLSIIWGFKSRIGSQQAKTPEHDKDAQIEAHKRDLVDKFEQARTLNQYAYGLLDAIDYFSYKKELLQHLYTGHRSVFSLIGKATTDEESRYEANQQMVKYVQVRVAESARALGIGHGQHGSDPFYSDSASQHVISLALENKNDFFGVYSDTGYQNQVCRESNNTVSQCAGYLSREQADKFAIALNSIARNPEVKTRYQKREDWAAKKDESTASALDALRDLLNSVSTKADNIKGFCHGCINMPGQRNVVAIRKELEDFGKIDWVKQKLRR
jgi:hypothetical protein